MKRTWYRKFVGVVLCNSLRYKIYLSDDLRGMCLDHFTAQILMQKALGTCPYPLLPRCLLWLPWCLVECSTIGLGCATPGVCLQFCRISAPPHALFITLKTQGHVTHVVSPVVWPYKAQQGKRDVTNLHPVGSIPISQPSSAMVSFASFAPDMYNGSESTASSLYSELPRGQLHQVQEETILCSGSSQS